MKLSKVQIKVSGLNETGKFIPWRGHILSGTNKSIAATRKAVFVRPDKFRPSDEWTVTHLPTGLKHSLLDSKNLTQAMRKARRLHKIMAKHGVLHTTDLQAIKAITPDFLKAFA